MNNNIKKNLRRLINLEIVRLKKRKTKLQEENPMHTIKIENYCNKIKLCYESLEYINNYK